MRNNTKGKPVSSKVRPVLKRKPNYHLWRARKQRQLAPKLVAFLLGHKTVDQICRYESGLRTPSLATALKLESIYAIPVRRLFSGVTDRVTRQLDDCLNSSLMLRKRHPHLSQITVHQPEYCSFNEKLRQSSLSKSDKDQIRLHLIALAKKLAEL
jgi:hypothetical protein